MTVDKDKIRDCNIAIAQFNLTTPERIYMLAQEVMHLTDLTGPPEGHQIPEPPERDALNDATLFDEPERAMRKCSGDYEPPDDYEGDGVFADNH